MTGQGWLGYYAPTAGSRQGRVGLEYDWRRWFAKVAEDQHANYGPSTMWRMGGGLRF